MSLLAFASMEGLLPEASTVAPRVDAMFYGLLVVSGGLVAILLALNVTFLIRYRRGSTLSRCACRLHGIGQQSVANVSG